ncbi:hypothetical protein HK099_003456, partial [Clydaea vesicula]
ISQWFPPPFTPPSSLSNLQYGSSLCPEQNFRKTALIFLRKRCDEAESACSEDIGRMLQSDGWSVKYCGIGEIEKNLVLSEVQLYVQPGGNMDVDKLFRKLTDSDIASIRNFVSCGGRYLGICLGAYLTGPKCLNLTEKSSPYSSKKGKYKPLLSEVIFENQTRLIYTEEPPELGTQQDIPGKLKILSRYTKDQTVQILIRKYNNGRVCLMGGHPEAMENWGNKHAKVVDKMAWDIGCKTVRQLCDDNFVL